MQRPTHVIRTKRSPPIWAVKVGARYVAHFSGAQAEQQATEHAQANYGAHSVIVPVPKRRAARLAELQANA